MISTVLVRNQNPTRLRPMKQFFFISILTSCFASNAQGPIDGFIKDKGELDIAISGTYSTSKIYFAGTDPRVYTRNQTIFGAFASYGLSDRWNLITSIPVVNYTLQDAAFYAKYKLIYHGMVSGEFSLFPAAGISFPISNYDTESGQSVGQKAITVQPKLVAQFKSKNGWFVQAQTGYNYSLNPVPDAYLASLKVGYIYKKWYFDAWFDFQHGIGGKDYGTVNNEPLNSFRELGVSHQRVGGVVYRTMTDRFGLQLNSFYVLNGRNTSQMFALGAGLVLKFNTNKQ